MSAAHELALYLAGENVGAFAGQSGWSVNVSREPVSPDDAVTLYDTGGPQPINYSIELRRPTIQVRVRSKSYTDAMDKQNEIFGILNQIKDQAIGDHTYLGVHLSTEILSIGRDDNDRHLLTANYQINRG